MDSDVIIAKVCSMVILTASSIIAGVLPLRLGAMFYKNCTSQKIVAFEKTMSFFLQFGAGVLLCTVFLHLMPELREHIEPITQDKLLPDIHLSYPDLIVCFGFFLIYSIEQITHAHLEDDDAHHSHATSGDTIELYDQCPVNNNSTSSSSCKLSSSPEKALKYKIIHCEVQTNGCAEHQHIKDGPFEHQNYRSFENHHHCITVEPATEEPNLLQQHLNHEHIPDFNNSIGSAFLTIMALSVHEVFEGMAVGLEDQAPMVWYLLAAISCHKIILSAFVGLQLLATKSKPSISYIFITIYAFTSSIGILVGLLVSLCSSQNAYLELTSVGLQGIATGTLIYVVFFEIYFKNENKYKLSGPLKAVSSICGFAFMAVLQMQLSEGEYDSLWMANIKN